jgi:hypothetical protein
LVARCAARASPVHRDDDVHRKLRQLLNEILKLRHACSYAPLDREVLALDPAEVWLLASPQRQ